VEDAEDAHRRGAGVLQAVLVQRRQVDARTGREGRVPIAQVEDALAVDDVDDLVVGVAVQRRAAGRNQADELGDVQAAEVLVDQQPELAFGVAAGQAGRRSGRSPASAARPRTGP